MAQSKRSLYDLNELNKRIKRVWEQANDGVGSQAFCILIVAANYTLQAEFNRIAIQISFNDCFRNLFEFREALANWFSWPVSRTKKVNKFKCFPK